MLTGRRRKRISDKANNSKTKGIEEQNPVVCLGENLLQNLSLMCSKEGISPLFLLLSELKWEYVLEQLS